MRRIRQMRSGGILHFVRRLNWHCRKTWKNWNSCRNIILAENQFVLIFPFPAQVVVTSELNPETHSSLRILTDHAEAEEVKRFLEQAEKRKKPGERDNIDALLQASVAANFGLYEEVRRDSVMCEALQELMKDEIEEKVNEAGTEETHVKNIRNIMDELKYTAEQAMDLLKIPQQKRSVYISKL
jgi:CRISPR/Cas system CSM-associated protein Csm2 small subunit